MIIVKCSGEYTFGGRTEDTFVIENCNTLEEFKELIEKKQPIIGKEPNSYYKKTIIAENCLEDRIIYLNNYLHVEEIYKYIMSKEELEDLDKRVCKSCKHNNESLKAYFQCCYIHDGNSGCRHYEQTLVDWTKSKFQKKMGE